jgi:hypothetical protein
MHAITWKDVFQMLRICDMLDHLGSENIFITLDTPSGDWNIKMGA